MGAAPPSGSTGPWLMRGEANDDELDVRFVAGRRRGQQPDALSELGTAFELEVPLGGFDDLPNAVVRGAARSRCSCSTPIACSPTSRRNSRRSSQACASAAEHMQLRVIFQARELTPDAEAVLAEFGVAEIAA